MIRFLERCVHAPADCLNESDEPCAKEKETARFRGLGDLASNLTAWEGGVVNIGISLSTIQSGDEASFCARNLVRVKIRTESVDVCFNILRSSPDFKWGGTG